MTQNILLETIWTPDGENNAYEIISTLLSEMKEKSEEYSPSKSYIYSASLKKLNQLMDLLE